MTAATATVYFSVIVDGLGSRSHRLMARYLYERLVQRAASRSSRAVALSPSICSAPTGWNPAGLRREEDIPGSSRRRTFVHSGLRHRNNSTAIFLALCRVSVTNGSLSFSKQREAHTRGKFTRLRVYFS